MHDPRVGRFFAVDPLAAQYAYNSPYAFSENRVIDGVELEGLEYYYSADGILIAHIGTSQELRQVHSKIVERHVRNAAYKERNNLVEKHLDHYQYDLAEAYENSSHLNGPPPVLDFAGTTPSDNLGKKNKVVERFIPPAVPTEFDTQLLKQEDSSDPSFDGDKGWLVDDSDLTDPSPVYWILDWNDFFPPDPIEPTVDIQELENRLTLYGEPSPDFERTVLRTVKRGDKSHVEMEFYGKGNTSDIPDSIVVIESDIMPEGRRK
jgi:hypothetical protein